MTIIPVLAAATVGASCLVNIARWRSVRSNLRWLDDQRSGALEPPPVLLLIPAYEEQLRLPELTDRLIAVRCPPEKLRILFVSSTAEPEPPDGRPTTAAVADDQVSRLVQALPGSAVAHLRCDAANPSMAIQLNAGLHWAAEQGWLTDDPYVGVIPADAYPAPDALQQLAVAVQRGTAAGQEPPQALQQPTTHLRTFAALGWSFSDLVRRAAGVYQSAFSIGVELSRLRAKERRPSSWRYAPLSGHGLFVASGTLLEHGGFPEQTWCEDIALTIGYHCAGVTVAPVASIEQNESPLSWPVYFNQARTWFTGATQYRRLGAFARQIAPGAERRRLSALAYRTWLSACWLGGPTLVLAALICLAVTAPPLLFLLAIVGWTAALYAGQVQLWRLCTADHRRPVREALAAAVFQLVLAPIGPALAVAARVGLLDRQKAKAVREDLDSQLVPDVPGS
ncbi:glycosyltransferase family 2 protein [Kribbella sp. NBC_01505]|uniref:glycosyltransferase n=1 Tax=Kribbella sp. NBC_01505 TaxID=2903580 RepID=UPI00386834D6